MNGRLISVSNYRRQFHLRLFRRFLEALERHPVLAQVDARLVLELLDDPFDDPLVEVVASEMGVAIGRLDLDDTFSDLEDRDVKGAATEVVDRDRLVLLLVQPVGQGGRGRLVDDPHDLETGDLAGVLRCLTLRIVVIRRAP